MHMQVSLLDSGPRQPAGHAGSRGETRADHPPSAAVEAVLGHLLPLWGALDRAPGHWHQQENLKKVFINFKDIVYNI